MPHTRFTKEFQDEARFFENGLTVPKMALIGGHRDPRMLSRYTHLRPEKVAEKQPKVAT